MTLELLAIDAAFATFGKPALYYAAGIGPGVPVTVIPEVPGVEQPFGQTAIKLAAASQALAKTLHLRRSEVAAPSAAEGRADIVAFQGTRLVVADVTVDETGEVWVLPTKIRRT